MKGSWQWHFSVASLALPNGYAASMSIDYFSPCSLGLEPALVQELQDLGAKDIQERRGGAAYCGDRALGYRANLWLRCAIRVQEKLLEGNVRSPEDLYSFVQRLDWQRFMSLDQTLAVDASLRDSEMTHSQYAGRKVKDAIVDQFRDRCGKRPNVDPEQPDLPIKLVILRNRATLYRNLSGDSLHKRGYRPIQVKSPLNEALAAGLLLMSDWDRKSPLVDPMCGSGTFLIEAACMATDRAPGLQRMFAFETWSDCDQDLWADLRMQASKQVRAELPFRLQGNDRHGGSIQLARLAAETAEVAQFIDFTVGDVRQFEPQPKPAWVVVNPPYGLRLEDGEELRDSWSGLGNFLHQECQGATAQVLCGNPEMPRLLGLRTSRKLPVMNGPIDCRWLRYEIAEKRPEKSGETSVADQLGG